MPKIAFRLFTVLVLLAVSAASPVAPATPAHAASCEFVLGFKALRDLITRTVGDCLEDEHHVANGDALQATTGGLLVWRKLDNWTAFTDGYRTWINGPLGLQQRLNTQRFSWEKDYPQTLVLTAADVPARAAVVETQTGATTQSPEVGWSDPAAAAARFRQAGWLSDYHATWYVPPGVPGGPAEIVSDAMNFQTSEGARAIYAAWTQEPQYASPVAGAPRVGVDSRLVEQNTSHPLNGTVVPWVNYVVGFHAGNVFAVVLVGGPPGSVSAQDVTRLARIVASRIG